MINDTQHNVTRYGVSFMPSVANKPLMLSVIMLNVMAPIFPAF